MTAREQYTGENGLFDRSSSLVMAAHELKSPLALLRQLALELGEQALTSRDKQLIIEQMQLVSERAMRLTTNITHSARLEQTHFPFEPINPSEVCEEVIHELTPLYRLLGREVQLEKRARVPLVVANRDLLRRILLNFGDNALYYSADEPIRFSIKQVDGSVRVGLRDNGPITAATPERSQLLAGRPESSGLGLEVCAAFARVMNGSIATIRHRNGMTFYVQLQPSTQMSLL